MKIQVICEQCNRISELVPKTLGQEANVQLQLDEFNVSDIDINKSGDLDEISDIDDIDATLNTIRIDCNHCGNYMVLRFE